MRTFRTVPAMLAAAALAPACLLGAAQAATEIEQGPFYSTNPDGQVGRSATVVVDGEFDDWTPEDVVAQGVANDDPRIFRGSHEGPVYDLYSLSAAWDEENLYLMWQFTNVTDLVDPAQTYPVSDNGKPYAGDIPISIALDVDPDAAGDGLVDGTTKGVWGISTTYAPEQGVDSLLMFSAKPGVGEPALFTLNEDGAFDYEEENVLAFEDAGIEYAYGDGLASEDVIGVDDNGNAGYEPEDLLDEDLYEDLVAAGHDPEQDTVYEMSIPLESLGITAAELESQGIGAMITSTFGESAIGSLPQDPAVLDAATDPYSEDSSTSAEKSDLDELTVPLARIGGDAETDAPETDAPETDASAADEGAAADEDRAPSGATAAE